MPTFSSKKFRPSSYQSTVGAWYRRSLTRHPFALFGFPFLFTIVAGSFLLTPATALRYERHDRKVQQLTQEEALGIGKDRRRVDINEEYYRLAAKVCVAAFDLLYLEDSRRCGGVGRYVLMVVQDLDDWDNRRVKRLPGENDGVV